MGHDFEALLGSAGEPGEGRFTLDPRRAREQLAAHALVDPYAYVLKLVQWAVTSGASSIDVRIAGGRLEFLPEGVAVEPLGAEGHLEKGRFDLALALATVERLKGEVTYGRGIVVEGVPSSLRMLDLLRTDVAAGWWQRLKTWLRPEAALLRLRCVYCPVPLAVNGERVDRAPRGQGVGEGSLFGCEAFFQRVPSHEWKYGQSRLTWVRYGVILGIEYGTLPDYIQAVASADAFMVDLSQFALVRGAGEPLVQRLRAACFDA